MRRMLEWASIVLLSIDRKEVDDDMKEQIKQRAIYLGESRNSYDLFRLLRLLHEAHLYELLPTVEEVETWFKERQVY